MDEDKEGQRGFRVTDRRRFSDTGERREDAALESSAAPAAPVTGGLEEPVPPEAEGALEPVTFSTFVLGLSTQALMLLGEIPNPATRAVERDLEAAKQVIDILGILQEKTRGNLEAGEQSLLESVLYDLRMRFVELLRPAAKGG